MGWVHRIVLTWLATLAFAVPCLAGPYDTAASNGVAWLIQQRNPDDGSWGASDAVKYVQTSEAVQALAALNQQNQAYYGGVTWLANHAPANTDFTSRRVLALGPASNSVTADVSSLQAAQSLAAPGNNGWGLSSSYLGSPIDTSLSLQALTQQGITTNVSQAVTYLTGSQLTGSDKGWTLGRETASDPVTTAQVLIALMPLQTYSGVPTAVTNGVSALNAKVTTSSPVAQIALAVVANLRNNPNSTQAVTLLNALVSQQAGDGSWGGDSYATALALRAMAAGVGKDLAAQKAVVSVPDTVLRNAINNALGHGALDAITVGQLKLLTSLTASGLGISDLTGLQYATNLNTLDVSNNNINSFAPIASLTIANLNETGNPGYGGGGGGTDTADVPTLPEWGAILLAGLLLLTASRAQANRRHGDFR